VVYQNCSKNTKNTNGPKFMVPRLAAVSPYFKESMASNNIGIQKIFNYLPFTEVSSTLNVQY